MRHFLGYVDDLEVKINLGPVLPQNSFIDLAVLSLFLGYFDGKNITVARKFMFPIDIAKKVIFSSLTNLNYAKRIYSSHPYKEKVG